jgi:hypothetical protein
MATTTKKTPKDRKAKVHRQAVKTSLLKLTLTNAELRQQLAESARELQDCKRQLAGRRQ